MDSSSQPFPPPTLAIANQPLMAPPTKNPRCRPRGSKNKPKSTSLSGQPIEPSVKLVTINVVPGMDVMETILDVAHRDHVSVLILNASGTIKNATVCDSPQGVPTLLIGPFSMLSFTGYYLYNNQYALHPGATPPPPFSFGIKLCTSHGQVFNGLIGGSVIAGDNVSLMVSTFREPNICKFIPEGKEGNNNDNNA
ncbi:hypothetical protein AAZX31_20G033400 [Glycine max]|uniref:AT-hook motif nuclear-localized protein 19-like n=1 Tax=Glycine max TaxID=3847 RepID=UPI00023DE1E0|nr:AT-hook motif nuclear-localized protein 19-like [Glycine max]KAG4909158.1 hypothetical protein JHK87_055274 [Glycine soja]KAG4906558.1 hypothetical protein JHK86_055042 [Glycine max]KAG4917734.1 hypothetical protein JHK85_056015 [Glycine max]KAG5073832.1 hypothetical protein JHK84_055063 [Glycine max]KAG5076507.1 hypothetical protein JHK82_055202 [Glycine max]|eukprot:XP_006606678.1 AT-hook motif nuclear-localized protein 19-like [Glycine max]